MTAQPEKSNRYPTAARRDRIAQLYIQGVPLARIAHVVDISWPMLKQDLIVLRKRWQRRAHLKYRHCLARELARIDRLEAAAWEGWERSSADEIITKVTQDGEKQKAERATRSQAGDPKFLDQVAWCIGRRCILLGLDDPESRPHAADDVARATPQEKRDRLAAILDQLRERDGVGDLDPPAGFGADESDSAADSSD